MTRAYRISRHGKPRGFPEFDGVRDVSESSKRAIIASRDHASSGQMWSVMLRGMQLRREASVSYRPLRRRLAAYGFAALVIGAATLDATVFAPEPRESRVAAPVEVEPAATAVTVEVDPPAAGTMLALPNV